MPAKPGYANHPLVQFVRSLEGEFYLAREVAEQLEVSKSMLALVRQNSPHPMGATHKAQYGSIVLHLYTPQRIAEIAEYMRTSAGHDLGNRKRGPVAMWTKTEQQRRRRNFDRARQYRKRAEGYRAAGSEKQAARMERMAAAVVTQLEKARQRRWVKVHGVPIDAEK